MTTETKEKRCAHSFIYRMEECLIKGELEEAERTAFDFLKSIRELKKLQKAKENREQLERVIQRLQEQGVLVERVAKIG
ncbi:hypothetical protein K7T73_06830 [Bacillus badius]|uniref:hypothetical protein n=1 Tax=Bacillus badius TaxID=1455 RepID=UPI001CBDC392|nr:hypothetical protein [Bacillus badius]UAT31930.1 hypothetical protein K7T73_06830 [Bacillus badius]